MPEILHAIHIASTRAFVFDAMTTPTGLNQWWTLDADGEPTFGALFRLGFGPEFQRTGRVTRCEPQTSFEMTM